MNISIDFKWPYNVDYGYLYLCDPKKKKVIMNL